LRLKKIILSNSYVLNYVIRNKIILLGNKKVDDYVENKDRGLTGEAVYLVPEKLIPMIILLELISETWSRGPSNPVTP
jgi:hypothetical protein